MARVAEATANTALAGVTADLKWASAEERPERVRITVLGATGSVGMSTLDLIGRAAESYEVVALTAQSNAARLAELAVRHNARQAVIGDEACFAELKGYSTPQHYAAIALHGPCAIHRRSFAPFKPTQAELFD